MKSRTTFWSWKLLNDHEMILSSISFWNPHFLLCCSMSCVFDSKKSHHAGFNLVRMHRWLSDTGLCLPVCHLRINYSYKLCMRRQEISWIAIWFCRNEFIQWLHNTIGVVLVVKFIYTFRLHQHAMWKCLKGEELPIANCLYLMVEDHFFRWPIWKVFHKKSWMFLCMPCIHKTNWW